MTDRKRSKEIDKYLAKEKLAYKKLAQEPKVLLLGSSDSGKSTTMKQFKLLYGEGFTDQMRKSARLSIIKNIHIALWKLVELLGPTLSDHPEFDHFMEIYETSDQNSIQSRECLLYLANTDNIDEQDAFLIGERMIAFKDDILNFWNNELIQNAFQTLPHNLPESTEYLMDKLEKILNKDYIPSNEDILQTRTVTRSVSETILIVENRPFHFFDVSGLRTDRHKWVPFFDSVENILFIVALSSYDMNLIEDPTVNRMADALVLFESICSNPLLKSASIILFLNKVDLFEKKIAKVKINKYFPDYKEKENNLKSGCGFFKDKFGVILKRHRNEIPFVQITCCTDTKAMSVALKRMMLNIFNSGQILLRNKWKKLDYYFRLEEN